MLIQSFCYCMVDRCLPFQYIENKDSLRSIDRFKTFSQQHQIKIRLKVKLDVFLTMLKYVKI